MKWPGLKDSLARNEHADEHTALGEPMAAFNGACENALSEVPRVGCDKAAYGPLGVLDVRVRTPRLNGDMLYNARLFKMKRQKGTKMYAQILRGSYWIRYSMRGRVDTILSGFVRAKRLDEVLNLCLRKRR